MLTEAITYLSIILICIGVHRFTKKTRADYYRDTKEHNRRRGING